MEPEDNETLQIGLVRTEGGSRILPSSDTVTVLILANDNAAGVVGFHTASRSVIAREGPVSFFPTFTVKACSHQDNTIPTDDNIQFILVCASLNDKAPSSQ